MQELEVTRCAGVRGGDVDRLQSALRGAAAGRPLRVEASQ